MIVVREKYLESIAHFIGSPVIKIITGVRRCGKSTLLELIYQRIKSSDNTAQAIILKMETYSKRDLESGDLIAKEVNRLAKGPEKKYLFIDEIQLATNWEHDVNLVFATKKFDIYITGSNSKLLSSEISTLLSGRFVEFDISTLSFAEYIQFSKELRDVDYRSAKEAFNEYLKFGGFPAIHLLRTFDHQVSNKMIQDIYSTIVLKDVVERNAIRNVDLLERVVEYLLRNVGNLFSAKRIHDYFKSELRSVSIDTILDYLKYLSQAFFVEKLSRYDVLGKRVLSVNEKYYVADISFINQSAGYDDRLIPGILENIVYLELRRRGYKVFIGQVGNKEIDFVAEKAGEKIYIQVAYLLKGNEQAIEREFSNMLLIKDQYPKYVLSLDEDFYINYEGIRHKNIVDFLLGEPRTIPTWAAGTPSR